jgi:hypothetical protein
VLTFPSDSQLSSIGDNAFLRCPSLQSIILPALLENITGLSLATLTSDVIEVDASARFLAIWDDFLTDSVGISLIRYLGTDVDIAIPNDVQRMAEGCFSGCQTVASVVFELDCSLSILAKGVFLKSSLESIVIPSSIEAIGLYCFLDCKKLSAVAFAPPAHVVILDAAAFAGCSSLRAISLPASIETIGEACFMRCSQLATVTFESGSQVARLGPRTFNGCASLESICIPSLVTEVCDFCFGRCGRLKDITFAPGCQLSSFKESVFSDS